MNKDKKDIVLESNVRKVTNTIKSIELPQFKPNQILKTRHFSIIKILMISEKNPNHFSNKELKPF